MTQVNRPRQYPIWRVKRRLVAIVATIYLLVCHGARASEPESAAFVLDTRQSAVNEWKEYASLVIREALPMSPAPVVVCVTLRSIVRALSANSGLEG